MEELNIASVNDAVMKEIADFADEYAATVAVDFGKRCAALEPGDIAPKEGSIVLNDSIRHIENYSFESQQRIIGICEGARAKALHLISEPPSADALRLMQSMAMRGDSVSDMELDAMLRTYGSNYQVRKFVNEVRGGYLREPDALDAALLQIDHALDIGKRYTSPRTYKATKMTKPALLSTAREMLYRTGMASIGA